MVFEFIKAAAGDGVRKGIGGVHNGILMKEKAEVIARINIKQYLEKIILTI
jgi:hypothetical protein